MPRLKLIPVITLTCLFVSGPIAAQSGANNRLITAEDFFAIKQVGSPNISPDGEWIAYTVRETNLEEVLKPGSGWYPVMVKSYWQ